MSDAATEDLYEFLQVSPSVDQETLGSVFRHMAKRFHPDNQDSGDADRFRRLVQAFEVLSDPVRRAQYDARREERLSARWRIFDPEIAGDDVAMDRRIRLGILSLLYVARRSDADSPGMGIIDMERVLGCPEHHMKFHIWYLKENGWIQRLDDGRWSITAAGVDRVIDLGGPIHGGRRRLSSGNRTDTAAA